MLSRLIKAARSSLSSISTRLVIIDGKTPPFGEILNILALSAGSTQELYNFTGANLKCHKIIINGSHTGGSIVNFAITYDPDGGGSSEQFWTPYIPANSHFNLKLDFPRTLYIEDPGDIDITSPANVSGVAVIFGKAS